MPYSLEGTLNSELLQKEQRVGTPCVASQLLRFSVEALVSKTPTFGNHQGWCPGDPQTITNKKNSSYGHTIILHSYTHQGSAQREQTKLLITQTVEKGEHSIEKNQGHLGGSPS